MSVHINMDDVLPIRRGTPEDRPLLFDVWLRSVEATHAFVSEADIQAFKPLVRHMRLTAPAVSRPSHP